MNETRIHGVAKTEPSPNQAIAKLEANQAVSGNVPFAQVQHMLEGSPPPRRPNRVSPIIPADPALRSALEALTPSNADLLKLAKRSPAPQEWYEE